MSNENNTRNLLIKNVTFYWAKLNPQKPVSPFGEEQWELTIQVPVKRKDELEELGKVKDGFEPKTVAVALKKKAYKKDGSKAQPVGVVDINKEPMDPRIIGNGSTGNVIVMLRDYEIKGPNGKVTKRGTSVMLNKVQVTELVEYERKGNGSFVDFDDPEEAPKTAKKTAAKKSVNEVDDDEIPF